MADESREVVIRITAKNLTDSEARAAAASVLGLNTQLTGASRSAKDGTEAFKNITKGMSHVGIEARESARMVTGMSQSTQQATTSGQGFGSMLGTMKGALGALGIGVTVGAVVNLGKALLDDADALVKLSDKTGISIQGLQKFKIAGADAGNTVEQLSSAVAQMQNRLAGGDASAVGALEKLNLRLSDLRGLSPDQQFMAIADAIRDVKDPADQVNIAMDLFGRTGAEILPTIKRGFDDIKDAAVGMSDETVKALDNAGDAMDRWWQTTKNTLGLIVGGAIQNIEAKGTGLLNKQAQFQKDISDGLIQQFSAYEAAALHVPQVVVPAYKSVTLSIQEQAAAEKVLGSQLAVITGKQQEHAKATKAAADVITKAAADQKQALGKVIDELLEMVAAEDKAAEKMHDMGWATRDTTARMSELEKIGRQVALPTINDMATAAEKYGERVDTGRAATKMLSEMMAELPDHAGAMQESVRKVGEELENSLGHKLKKSLGGLNDVFKSAFEGGGGWKGASASFATDVTKNLLSAIPVIGPMIGQFAGAIVGGFKKLFGGPSQKELEGRQALADIEKQLHELLTSTQRLQSGGETWRMTVIAVRDAYIATGRSEQEALAAVETFWAAQKNGAEATVEAFAPIQAVLDQQRQSHEALDAAVQKYGFSVDQLGPKFRQQKLHEMASELFTDYGLLTGSGIEVGNVTARMADKVNEYIGTVRKAGTEVPAEMRPMLESFAKQGLLTDENGNKITDLKDAGIIFAKTMSQGFDGIIKKLDELLVGLGVKLPKVINDIPDRTVNIRGRWIPPEDGPGDQTEEEQWPGHAMGGVFHREHLARIAEGGKSEIVGDVDFMAAALAGAMTKLSASHAGATMAPTVPNIYVLVDPTSGNSRFATRAEIEKLRRAFAGNLIQVPVSAIQSRSV